MTMVQLRWRRPCRSTSLEKDRSESQQDWRRRGAIGKAAQALQVNKPSTAISPAATILATKVQLR
jgi:hypothetical protein